MFTLYESEVRDNFQIPATMNRYLRDYQREGAQFMYNRFREGGGGILGDDMGLGKTVQVWTFHYLINTIGPALLGYFKFHGKTTVSNK